MFNFSLLHPSFHLKLKIGLIFNKHHLMFTRIHRRSEKTTPLSEDYDASGSDSSFKSAPSPAVKRRATRLSVTKYPRELVRRFHLDRQSLGKKKKK